jgi:hypothetical protein
VVDRIAVVVGKTVITESEVRRELALTHFQNNQPPVFSAEQRRAAAERLVDQQLIRNEMEAAGIAPPSPDDADELLREFRKERFAGDAQYREALARYGITEKELKDHLAWQLAAIRFTDARFPAPLPDPDAPAPPGRNGADRSAPGSDSDGADRAGDNGVQRQMEAWLKEARGRTRIQFKKEAFQ